MSTIDYQTKFERLLRPHLASGTSISKAELFGRSELGEASDQTKLKNLKKFLGLNPEYLGCVPGVLPPAETIIDIAAQTIGSPVSEENVSQANRVCAEVVEKATGPLVGEFVKSGLISSIDGSLVTISIQDLTRFLVDEFATFLRGSGNSLVSVAGSLNEKLLVRCLVEKGMTANLDFTGTGTESQGDIVIHSKSGSKTNLNVEIKSYHARERLLRGLRDIHPPKVGAGFFVDPSEFNPRATIRLLQTNTAAIYMPQETLAKLSPESLSKKTSETIAHDSHFYRPLERFASDMAHFGNHGILPPA
jgi:hypothetical protein